MVHKTQLAKWGNSLAIRIPRHVADGVKLRPGDVVEMAIVGPGEVRLRRTKEKTTLRELLGAIIPANLHDEADWGGPVGKEIW